MFHVNDNEIQQILQDYGIVEKIRGFFELERYHYERDDPDSKEVRLIVKVEMEDRSSFVMRFKNEEDVTIELIESQSRFAEILQNNGILTPTQYKVDGKFAKWYRISGYDVIVTVEEFVENELKVVDERIAGKTGELLARMHTIAESNELHINNGVLFDPFAHNDLLAYDIFLDLEASLEGEDKVLFDKIVDKYNQYMDVLEPLKKYPRYAVQGDISNCNLYLAPSGEVGVFDFNRAGDNNLFCDAAMQAIYEARRMDYPESRETDFEAVILKSFLDGYCSIRSLSDTEKQWYPYLQAIITAFWSDDIRWNEDSLHNAHKAGDAEGVRRWLLTIWERLSASLSEFPITT